MFFKYVLVRHVESNDYMNKTDISIGQYVRARQLELSDSVSCFKTVYLDTNHWVTLRKVCSGELTDPLSKRYLECVTALAEGGICLFPISQSTFLEVLKQTDPRTLDQTVAIIDKLSKGISFISHEERLKLETLHYFYDKTGESTYNSSQLVWTKLAYIMGYTSPEFDEIEVNTNNVLQKSFFDRMWEMTLNEMICVMRGNGGLFDPSFPDNSRELNVGKFAHMHENKSFKKMFLSELAGMLDAYKPLIQEAMLQMFEHKMGRPPSRSDVEAAKKSSLACNAIYNLFKLNKVTIELPIYRIISGLFAAVRWDKKQLFQPNDMHDFWHASAALPYCDYFFTEKDLLHLVTQKMLSYDKLYDCQVTASVKSAVERLEELVNRGFS